MTKEYTKFQVGQKESNGSAGLEEQRSLRDSREEAAMQQPLQMGQGLYRQTCSEDTQEQRRRGTQARCLKGSWKESLYVRMWTTVLVSRQEPCAEHGAWSGW